MRKFRLFAPVLLVAGLAACSHGHKTTILTGNGTATVTTSQDNKTATITTKGGSMTMGKGAVDVSKLGVPVYPGAVVGDGGYAMSGPQGSGQMATLTTTDPFEKVYQWYKSQMPAGSQQMKVESGDSSIAEFAVAKGANDRTTIMITSKKDETDIVLTHSVSVPTLAGQAP
ncbi:MAG: hypothetical protein ACYDGM_13905 [Vulcanimicrobiaceae bacterium]